MEQTIRHNTRNTGTFVSLLVTGCFVVGIIIAMRYNWPPDWSFEWIVMSFVLAGSLLLVGGYGLWIFRPKIAWICITSESVSVFDAPGVRWVDRKFDVDEISRFIHRIDDRRCWIQTRDGTNHRLSDHLALEHDRIVRAFHDLHPQIECDIR